jgi:hypothetical protein
MKLNISNTFCENLPADPILKNFVRQVENACDSFVMPTKTEKPEVIHFSEETLEIIGLQPADAASIEFLNIFSGNAIYPHTKPYAMCYGGHQFGTVVPLTYSKLIIKTNNLPCNLKVPEKRLTHAVQMVWPYYDHR